MGGSLSKEGSKKSPRQLLSDPEMCQGNDCEFPGSLSLKPKGPIPPFAFPVKPFIKWVLYYFLYSPACITNRGVQVVSLVLYNSVHARRVILV